MPNRHKIITMTKLALYDKHQGSADRAANAYFRHDYIYKKNLATRLAVGFAGILILGLYWLNHFLATEADIFEMEFADLMFDSALFLLALLAVYTVFGTLQATRQYYLVQKRLREYNVLLDALDRRTAPYAAPEDATQNLRRAVRPLREYERRNMPRSAPPTRRTSRQTYDMPDGIVPRARPRPRPRHNFYPADAPLVRRERPRESYRTREEGFDRRS